jgi:glycosyltransferase involved in cell wall biosynthesis
VAEEVSRLQLGDRIILPGWVTPEEVHASFKHGDIVFMPSLSEGMPVVGLNALAMGLAILASRIGGWADLVAAGKNGLLLDSSSSAEAWGEALRNLVNDPSRLEALRLASRQKAADFDLKKIVDSYEVLFKQVALLEKQ